MLPLRRLLLTSIAAIAVCATAARPGLACIGDCNGDGEVTIDEILRGVNVALGSGAIEDCIIFDRNLDGTVSVDEIVTAVNGALGGCSPTPTPTATATPSVVPNMAPVVTPAAVYRGYAGFPIALAVQVADPEGNAIACVAAELPTAGLFTGSPGTLQWTPSAEQLGPAYVPFTCTDDGVPPAATHGQLTLVIQPVDSCTIAICDAAVGCSSQMPPLAAACCREPAPAVSEPDADCPAGGVLLVSDEFEDGAFQTLRSCDLKRVRNSQQASATVRMRLRARCISLDDRARVRARMETATRQPMFDREYLVPFTRRDDGFVESPIFQFDINLPRPFFDLEASEANLTVTLRDARNQELSESLRLRLTFTPIPTPVP